MKFSNKQKVIIKEWYNYISIDSQHYGNGAVMFPNEAFLLKKLASDNENTEFSSNDLDLIYEWMQSNIKRQYGDAQFLMGEELTLYKIINQEINNRPKPEIEFTIPETSHESEFKIKTKHQNKIKSEKRKKYMYVFLLIMLVLVALFFISNRQSEITPTQEKITSQKIEKYTSKPVKRYKEETIESIKKLKAEKVHKPSIKKTSTLPMKPRVPKDMVLIKGDEFIMGDVFGDIKAGSPELPTHKVKLNSFYFGKTVITQKEWKSLMGNNPSFFTDDNLPVEQITWHEAILYCNKRSLKEQLTPAYTINGNIIEWNTKANGYRLPTEAEWEYAARERGKNIRFGNGKNELDPKEANFDGKISQEPYSINGQYLRKTTPVNLYKPNSLGLYDMAGNIWVWCWDWYNDNYYSISPVNNPIGPNNGIYRVIRGGGWGGNAFYLRASYRNYDDPGDQSLMIGFRLARSYF